MLVVEREKQVIKVYGLNKYLISAEFIRLTYSRATSDFRLSGRTDLADHNATSANAPTRSTMVQKRAVRVYDDAGKMTENHPRYSGD